MAVVRKRAVQDVFEFEATDAVGIYFAKERERSVFAMYWQKVLILLRGESFACN